MPKKSSFPPKKIAIGFAVASFLAIRYGLEYFYRDLGETYLYALEIAFSASILALYRRKFRFKGKFPVADGLISVALGFCVYTIAWKTSLGIPFDFSDRHTLIFLCLLGPLIEELLFRQALWFPIEDLSQNKNLSVLLTSAVFAFGHFYTYFFVADEVRPFIVYQTVYTFLLGLWWGARYAKSRAFTTPLGLHFCFNLGFYFASLA